MSTAAEIPNRFDFATAGPRIYQLWLDANVFSADPDSDHPPFTIVIPPPNVTGALHLGHALNNTLQDILVRMKRMQGFNTLWMPGTDHAGIATQAVVERRLKEEEQLDRHSLGRSGLIERIWEWKNQYETRILGQLKQMGCSCDWDRTRFTLDQTCARAVRETFFSLFDKDLIYRGKRLVNWDTHLKTAVSDDEVESKTVKGHFWHFKYPVIDPQPGEPTHVLVATTRPETMLGDTAVAVHPDPAKALDKVEADLNQKLAKAPAAERDAIRTQIESLRQRRTEMLASLIQLRDMARAGRKLMLPLMNREIPMVTDTWPKPELGSGCVKVTPAHDPNDYEVAKRCGLEMINIMNIDGTLNAETGSYQGLTMKQARQQVVTDLDALGLVDQIEDREIELPHSDRSKTPIEPFLADQWFVRMNTLAQLAMDAVADGRVEIHPPRYQKGYLDWLGEKRDWPVSRQLWWGHQIPVWSLACPTRGDCDTATANIKSLDAYNPSKAAIKIEPCSEEDPHKRKELGLPDFTLHVCIKDEGDALEDQLASLGFARVEDVLDTWFSSALWPHSTLGWPESTPELQTFYPTSTLITSRDIITLWVARMVLMGLHNLGRVPFKDVFIHPKILDGQGETMSKSKGNGIDPLDVINKFGADALRFSMARLTTETQDVRMPVQFECPHCGNSIEQTKKNRELPAIECSKCQQRFSTQWARTEEDKSLPRGPVLSERFEVARNFCNKLWNAARFAMLNLVGYSSAPIAPEQMTVEDRWIVSRLSSVAQSVTQNLEQFKYAEASRELYDFAWDEFCSFYVEMLKDRFHDDRTRPHAQRMLAFSLDQLLRLLHPFIPFITEEIWQLLGEITPSRGLHESAPVARYLAQASWPAIAADWQNQEIESQFAIFQRGLGTIREIRSRQNLTPKQAVNFSVRCSSEIKSILEPMGSYFASMACATLTAIGADVTAPKPSATVAQNDFEIYVDLTGLIDEEAEVKRLEKESARLFGLIAGKEKKLSNEKFVSNAPAEIVERERESLALLKEQLATVTQALAEFIGN